MATTPAWPVRLDTAGRLATVEYGSDEHARQAAGLIATTTRGERIAQPTAGVPTTIGEPDIDINVIIDEIERQAPYARVLTIDTARLVDDPLTAVATIDARGR